MINFTITEEELETPSSKEEDREIIEQVNIDPSDPEKCVGIGANLDPVIKEELIPFFHKERVNIRLGSSDLLLCGLDRSVVSIDLLLCGLDRSVGSIDMLLCGLDRPVGSIDLWARSTCGLDRPAGSIDLWARSTCGLDRHVDMTGIDPNIVCLELNMDTTFKPIKQKMRTLGPEQPQAVNDEVERLFNARSIEEVRYPDLLANLVVVKKKNGKWRVCVNFTDLNKSCPKDNFRLPHIDRLVEATAGNELLSFMDAFSGYNQIMMHSDDREKTNEEDHIKHLKACFESLNSYGRKLNLTKCSFAVMSGEFMDYIVTKRGIKANPKKITAILDLPSPRNVQEVQQLTVRIAALTTFISRLTDKCLPFYELLRRNQMFEWDARSEESFKELKQYLSTPQVLSKHEQGKAHYLYISVSSSAVSRVLVKENQGEQKTNSRFQTKVRNGSDSTCLRSSCCTKFTLCFSKNY
ncbi:unnamed protein product [Microthlaspi erraticum]|uniref:Reverse transcriptase domain-containing protein n=1 Tax=Microthlaspi erraticum TaxID=1685480 RepID=A0A6D2IT43_9BRAS|nr:unnamed protein product [Microthlaspi erraticum]